MTRDYSGLQGVRVGSKRLQEVTKGYRSYKGLEGVTEGYRWLQEVKRGYRGLRGVTEGQKKL